MGEERDPVRLENQTNCDSSSVEEEQQPCHKMQSLPMDFQLSCYTVIIGKGKEVKLNIGNQRLRALATAYLPKYSNGNKREKSTVVSEVIKTIYDSPGGNFVRQDKDGSWHAARHTSVREKVGYVFRDLLADQYRSSSKSKVALRVRQAEEKVCRRTVCAKQEIFSVRNSLKAFGKSQQQSSLDIAKDQQHCQFQPLTILQTMKLMEQDTVPVKDLLSAPILNCIDKDTP